MCNQLLTTMRKQFIIVMLISSLCWATVWYQGTTHNWTKISHLFSSSKELDAGINYQPKELDSRPSRFIYLVQTESCIPDHLKSPRAIGDASACQCDVLVLSYKKMCTGTPPAHVEYIFNTFKNGFCVATVPSIAHAPWTVK